MLSTGSGRRTATTLWPENFVAHAALQSTDMPPNTRRLWLVAVRKLFSQVGFAQTRDTRQPLPNVGEGTGTANLDVRGQCIPGFAVGCFIDSTR